MLFLPMGAPTNLSLFTIVLDAGLVVENRSGDIDLSTVSSVINLPVPLPEVPVSDLVVTARAGQISHSTVGSQINKSGRGASQLAITHRSGNLTSEDFDE